MHQLIIPDADNIHGHGVEIEIAMPPYVTQKTCRHCLVTVYGNMPWQPQPDGWEKSHSFENLAEGMVKEYGVRTIFMPRFYEFNGRVITVDDVMAESHEVPVRVLGKNVTVFSRALADGIFVQGLNPETGLAYVVGDCPVVYIEHPEKNMFAVLHAGRDSLHPLRRSKDWCNRYKSVIDAGLAYFPENIRHELVGHIFCSIAPEHFEHRFDDKKYGESNRELIGYLVEKYGETSITGDPEMGRINLPELIKLQCTQAGMPYRNVSWDYNDTYSHERLSSVRAGDPVSRRNGVLIVPH